MRREHKEFEKIRLAFIRKLEANEEDGETALLRRRYHSYVGGEDHLFWPDTYTHNRQRKYLRDTTGSDIGLASFVGGM